MIEKLFLTWPDIIERVNKLDKSLKYYGVKRGGQPIAAMLNPVDTPDEADIIIDDLIDSGATRDKYVSSYPQKQFLALYDKQTEPDLKDKWLVFPWEGKTEDVQDNVVRILQYLGEDVEREGLKDTPKRYIKFLKEFLTPVEFNFTTFEDKETDEMVIVKDIYFYSMCEHHMAPFFGKAHVAYIPDGKIVGISKLARVVDLYANRFQNQERITTQVAQRIQEELSPKGVAVYMEATHMCMCMRGVKKPGAMTVTSKMLGSFKSDMSCRNEFLNLIK